MGTKTVRRAGETGRMPVSPCLMGKGCITLLYLQLLQCRIQEEYLSNNYTLTVIEPMFALPDRARFQFSRPISAILLTTLLFTGLLVANTVQNLNREQRIMEEFLLDEGLTLIRSFEAGARTTMMHEMMGGVLPIETLLKETVKTRRIAYIVIVAEDGSVIAAAGDHNVTEDTALTRKVFQSRKPATNMVEKEGHAPIFEVAEVFQALPGLQSPMMGLGHGRWNKKSPLTLTLENGQAVIHLGLHTDEFVTAQKQDLMNSLFMGAILFLLGCCGFYLLFFYQGMAVTRSTLTNMKLYTKNIIESMPDGLMTLDSQGRVAACNPRVSELAVTNFDAMMGKYPEDLFPEWPVDSLKADRGRTSFSYIFRDGDGKEIPVEISSSPLLDSEGKHQGAVFLLRDLREIRSLEEQLNRSRHLAALGRMAAGIAHEIRNPLGTLRGFAQFFGARANDDDSKEYSALMIAEVDRLNESISTLLQFSRPRDPEFTLVEIATLMQKTSKLLEYDFKEHANTLVVDRNCSGAIEADADLLLQVLLNLLKNAIASSETGSEVRFFCEDGSQSVRITVADTGIGMNIKVQEQMFDPFFTTKKSGTGLGLAVSHQIVEQHNGNFEVESVPGQGTSVTMILPRKQTNHPKQEG